MKKLFVLVLFPWLATLFGQPLMAQDVVPPVPPAPPSIEKKEAQEIIIRKKGNKDATLNLQITGNKITINGKPLAEFKDDAITINNKKIIINTDKFTREFEKLKNLNFDNLSGNFNFDNPSMARPFLGVSTEKNSDGAKIISVTTESAAEEAGLQKDDIITKINDSKITGPNDLYDAINKLKENDKVTVSYKRSGKKEKTVTARLRRAKVSEIQSFTFNSPDGGSGAFMIPPAPPEPPQLFNFDDKDARDNYMDGLLRKQRLGIKIQDTEEGNGVKILEVDKDSPAEKAGVQKDDVLVAVNGDTVSNTDEARALLQENMSNSNYPLKVKRNAVEMTLTVKIPKKLKTADL